ncbi:MAG: HlyD family efflux transporter periplasmic adaptor subunit [Micropepsaceae bacterium]
MLSPLFRQAAIVARRTHLEGDVVLRDAGVYRFAGYLLPMATVPFLVATLFWSYARVQATPGWLTTSEGLVLVRAGRAGTLDNLPFREGDFVRAGAVVANVRVEQGQATLGETPETALLSILGVQAQLLEKQIELARTRGVGEVARQKELIAGLVRERAEIDQQLSRQSTIVASSWRDVEAVEALTGKGFVSGREVRNRRAVWSEQARDESSLRQQREALESRIASARSDLVRLPLDMDTSIAQLEATRAELAQRRAEVEGRRSYSLIAPISGRITNLNVRRGYAVDAQKPVMAIVPDGAALEAELFVPTIASAFIKSGQEVRLLYDAFPYQRFGSGTGTIMQVSQSAVAPGDMATPQTFAEPVYVVRVRLRDSAVTAFGEKVSLKPGMTLKANVMLEERSIFAWIFEPLYAVRGRT